MHELCSLQCAYITYYCDHFKCSRQVASSARQSSAKRSLQLQNTKLTILSNFPCAFINYKERHIIIKK